MEITGGAQQMVGRWKQLHFEERRGRRDTYQQLADAKGSIKSVVRVRPVLSNEQDELRQTGAMENVISFEHSDAQGDVEMLKVIDEAGGENDFELDQIFRQAASNEDIAKDVYPLIYTVMDGFNAIVVSHGATNSGKSHTLHGGPNEVGVATLCAAEIFALADERAVEWDYTVTASYIEVYGEEIRDLSREDPTRCQIGDDDDIGVHASGAQRLIVKSDVDVESSLVAFAEERRQSWPDYLERKKNAHTILSLYVLAKSRTAMEQYRGKIHFVDLGDSGSGLAELQLLSDSLNAVRDGADATDLFKGTLLTQLMGDSFQNTNGDPNRGPDHVSKHAKCFFIGNVGPTGLDTNETLATLQFAQATRGIEVGAPIRQVRDNVEETEQMDTTSGSGYEDPSAGQEYEDDAGDYEEEVDGDAAEYDEYEDEADA